MLESNPLKSRMVVRRVAIGTGNEYKDQCILTTSTAIARTSISQTKIFRVESPEELPVYSRIPPFQNMIMIDLNPYTRRILARITALSEYRYEYDHDCC